MDREVLYYKFIAGFFVFICASVFLLPEVSPQEKRERLAVAPFEVSGGISDSSVGSIVSDLILSRLSDKFEIYERTLLRKLIDERALQASDLAEARPNAVEAMRLVGVKMLVVGQVARLEGKVVVTARVVDCVSGKVLTKGDVSAESLDALPDRIDELLNKLRLKDGSLGGRG
ncbi:MAG: hypothetical protein N2234_03290, partial [Planctomycetota bacterium]|nr:hypothetical protein [Planctomycetota bacterium]